MMSDTSAPPNLCAKIARLVEERGWNQEEFARIANLNRLTVRGIIQGGQRKLHNATVSACARALGVSVNDLRNAPLERLLPRMHTPSRARENLREIYERASQPELIAWLERNPERAGQLSPDEIDELLSLQGTGGPLTVFGVAHWVELIERKRRLLEMASVVAGTEYFDLLEQFVVVLYDRVQPYRDRGIDPNTDSPN
jgi:transcriptional regulator with XRE-family HTH domain